MKIDDIFALWEQDSKIDSTELGAEEIKIPQLHHKYFKIYSNEKLLLRKLREEYKQLKLAKYEFYTQGANEDTPEHWKLPPIGRILRADVQQYIDADSDIIALSLKIGLQEEKIELLDSIIRSLNSRGYNIKAAIDYLKFTSGVG
jgi:hypothetical protein